MAELSLTVNGEDHTVDVDPAKPLADVLRDELGLPGTKQSCSTGICGACTVRIDGEARKSCLHMAGAVEDADIRTVEDLVDGETNELHPVQEAFLEEFSFQCGFCTPGFLNSTLSLLDENPNPTEEEIKDALHGNICRCTGYVAILEGVKAAAEKYDPETEVEAAGD
ncbi:(2Fe-2S)-binding protein [Natrinema gelatinilyticum]|uniref:(2Fe-2S)-binding protein n=1 Tax=Natrinema gelatinilyticum TaxID=2961571 RepID=UPI0020C2C715|nr:(2Fe-2S)-binding protein [Natrinema gelatinilyticum]